MVLAAEAVFRVWIVYDVIAKRHKKYGLKNVYYKIVYNNKCLANNILYDKWNYTCLEISSVQAIEIVEKFASWGLFEWKEFSAATSFFRHPLEVVA